MEEWHHVRLSTDERNLILAYRGASPIDRPLILRFAKSCKAAGSAVVPMLCVAAKVANATGHIFPPA